MGAHGGGLGHVPCFVRSGAFSADLEYRGAGNTQKSGKSVSHTEKYAGHAEAHHCGAVFLSGVSVSLWRKSATTVFAVVPAGNLRVIGVFPGAAYTFEIKKKSRKFPVWEFSAFLYRGYCIYMIENFSICWLMILIL